MVRVGRVEAWLGWVWLMWYSPFKLYRVFQFPLVANAFTSFVVFLLVSYHGVCSYVRIVVPIFRTSILPVHVLVFETGCL